MNPSSNNDTQENDLTANQQPGAPALPESHDEGQLSNAVSSGSVAQQDFSHEIHSSVSHGSGTEQTENTNSTNKETVQQVETTPPHSTEQLQTTVGPGAAPVFQQGKPKSKKKVLIIVALSVVVALLLGGGALLAYLGVYLPNRPDNVLKTAFFNTIEAEQVRFDGEFESKTNGDSDILAMKMTFDGGYNTSNSTATGSLVFTVSGMEVEVDTRMVDDNMYVKVGDLSRIQQMLSNLMGPETAEAQMIDNMLEQAAGLIQNQWIVFDSTLLEQAGMGCITNISFKLSEADKELMEKKYVEHPFISINDHSQESLDGFSTIKYELTVNNKQSEAYLNSLDSLSFAKKIQEGCSEAQKEIDQQVEAKDIVNDGTTKLIVWVDSASKRIIRVAADEFELTNDSKARGVFEYNMNYESVNVEKPKDSKPALEVYSEIVQMINRAEPALTLE